MNERRLEALRAMANQDASPHERDIARAKLAELGGGDREPPRRPPARAASFEDDERRRAELVRRWQQGAFHGYAFRAGAGTTFTAPGTSTSTSRPYVVFHRVDGRGGAS